MYCMTFEKEKNHPTAVSMKMKQLDVSELNVYCF